MILLLFIGQYVLEKINLPDNTEPTVKKFVSETHGVIDLPYYIELHLTLRKTQMHKQVVGDDQLFNLVGITLNGKYFCFKIPMNTHM